MTTVSHRRVAALCCVLLVAAAGGCGRFAWMMPRGWSSSPPPAISMEEAVRIAARAARAARPGIRDIRPSASFRDGRWFVAMTYTEDLDPFGVLMVEGGCTVIVDESGTVVGRRSGAHSR